MTDKINKGGAPQGNQNAAKTRRWMQALDKALKQYNKGDIKAGQALDRIAERVIELALTGNDADFRFAIQEIGNRIDGKPSEHKFIDKSVSLETGGLSEAAAIFRLFAGSSENDDDAGAMPH